jgi:hypothetical protein
MKRDMKDANAINLLKMLHIELIAQVRLTGTSTRNASSHLHKICLARRYQTIRSCTYLSESRRERASARLALLVLYSGCIRCTCKVVRTQMTFNAGTKATAS